MVWVSVDGFIPIPSNKYRIGLRVDNIRLGECFRDCFVGRLLSMISSWWNQWNGRCQLEVGNWYAFANITFKFLKFYQTKLYSLGFLPLLLAIDKTFTLSSRWKSGNCCCTFSKIFPWVASQSIWIKSLTLESILSLNPWLPS